MMLLYCKSNNRISSDARLKNLVKIREFKNSDESYTISDGSEFLHSLKKVNIFVGANNSGKSRFLRQIFKASIDDLVLFKNFNKDLKEIQNALKPEYGDLFYMSDLAALVNSTTGDYPKRYNEFCRKINEQKQRSHGSSGRNGTIWDLDVAQSIRTKMMDLRLPAKYEDVQETKLKHVYVPILRGLRHLDLLNATDKKEDLYTARTVADYNLTERGNDDSHVFSGLSIYGEIKKMLLGSREDRHTIAQFQDFISESFFGGQEVTLIPDHDSDNVKLNINDGKADREICNVGDGIQSILINTFEVFRYRDKNVALFVEEPELMMHPAMQRILIETFINKFGNLQVFLTTHSNHFLDLTYEYPDDVAIFLFEEVGEEHFKISNVTDHKQILDLLGVRNSSVFLANSVIWTEGVTDRMLVRRLLDLDQQSSFREDFHYAFAEYGGNNLKNFEFTEEGFSDAVNVRTLSKVNYVIADNDGKSTGKKSKRRENLKKVLGKDHVFDGHVEIENLIPYKVWVTALQRLLQDHQRQGIQIKAPTTRHETQFNEGLKTRRIGDLLKSHVIKKREGSNPGYFSVSDVQCIGFPKKIIMEYIISAIDELKPGLTEFPQQTRSLIRSLKNFIENANEKQSQ